MKRRRTKSKRKKISVSLPLPPHWIKAKMAALAGSSHLMLVYDATRVNAILQGPVGLSNIGCITGTENSWTPLLEPPTVEEEHFGIMAVQELNPDVKSSWLSVVSPQNRRLPPGNGKLVIASWVFALVWKRGAVAWDTLLYSLDALRPHEFVIAPEYLLPTLFVARMAGLPRTSAPQIVHDWGPLLQETQDLLVPLIYALMGEWIRGPSRSAAVYREYHEYSPLRDEHLECLVNHLEDIIGAERVERIRAAERFEPTLLRVLDEASYYLWNSNSSLFREKHLDYILTIQALLPIALWRLDISDICDITLSGLQSLADLYDIWRDEETMNS